MIETNKINSLYLHFPFCRHLCNYCDFFKKKSQNQEDYRSFEEFLEKSWEVHSEFLKTNNYEFEALETLYIGGGTPSLWGSEGAKFLEKFFKKNNLSLQEGGEFTLEVNPGAWKAEGLESWKGFGINRYSLGIQSLRSDFLKVLDRVHSLEEVHETLRYFNEKKYNFSVDFMLGLPMSKELKRDVIFELEEILKYNPEHISLYILTTKDQYVHSTKIPNEEWIEKEFLAVSSHLQSKGFVHYEVSNFAKPKKESIHNLNYWRSKSVAALGPSATGLLAESQKRYKWKVSQADFTVEELNEEQTMLERLYMSLRTFDGVDLSSYLSEEAARKCAEHWKQQGHAIVNNSTGVKLTSKGYLLLDSLLDDVFKLQMS